MTIACGWEPTPIIATCCQFPPVFSVKTETLLLPELLTNNFPVPLGSTTIAVGCIALASAKVCWNAEPFGPDGETGKYTLTLLLAPFTTNTLFRYVTIPAEPLVPGAKLAPT